MGINTIKENWNKNSDSYYQRGLACYDQIAENPERAFPIALYPVLRKYFPDLKGKRVCVPSSGDNVAAFGFHLLGAEVTSADLSDRQIFNAKQIAEARGWKLNFVCDDSMELGKIADDQFDLVYTSNGVHVWIPDLPKMYGNFNRILKKGGIYLFFETHPMIRPFDNTTYEVKIVKPYEEVGPFGEIPTYDWRTQDFVNSAISAGFTIREMLEFHSLREDNNAHNYLHIQDDDRGRFRWPGDAFDWRTNPWAAFPQCLSLCVQKG